MAPIFKYIIENWVSLLLCIFFGIVIGVLSNKIIHKSTQEDNISDEKGKGLTKKISISIIYIIMMIFMLVSFFIGDKQFSISTGIIYTLVLMMVLVFYDSVESFSLGNLVTLKKEIKKKNDEVKQLSKDNSELRSQILSVVTASISNQNKIVLGFGDSWLKNAKLESASQDEKYEEETNIDNQQTNDGDNYSKNDTFHGWERSKFARAIDEKSVKKYAESLKLNEFELYNKVKFADEISDKDPIMEPSIVFDAYLKRPLEELFINVISSMPNINIFYRIYYMISIVVQYAQANNISAKVILLVPIFPDVTLSKMYPHRNQIREIERLKNKFKPAVKNGFLEIMEINFSEEECNNIIKGIKTE